MSRLPSNPDADASLARRRAARSRMLERRVETAGIEETRQTLLAFNQGLERYAIPLSHVLEIQALDYFTPVPGTPGFLPGIVHWRGTLLTLIDLGKLVGIGESGLSDLHVWIVVEAAGRRVGVVAREVEDIVAAAPRQIARSPECAPAMPPEWILGIFDENRLIVNMDAILRDARLAGWRGNTVAASDGE